MEIVPVFKAGQNDQHAHALARIHGILQFERQGIFRAVFAAVLRHHVHNRILHGAAVKVIRLDHVILHLCAGAGTHTYQQRKHGKKSKQILFHTSLSLSF